jgi:tetratricopeptide (TPR) repeat protein
LVANAYYLFGDHESAVKYYREALSIPDEYLLLRNKRGAYNGLGLAFKQFHQFDSAVHYFGLTYEISRQLGEEFWMALANGNRGNAYFLNADYDNALPLLLEDFTVSKRVGEIGSAANASLGIAAIYLHMGMPEEAEPYIEFASTHVDRSNIRALSGYYENQFLVHRLKKQYAQALLFVDSFHVARDSILKIADVKLIDRARMTVFAEQHAREVAGLEAARSRQILIRNGLLIVMVLLGIIAYQWYNRQRLRKEKELQLANLREEAAAVALFNARKELEVFTKTLKDKNDLIDSFKGELDQLHSLGASQLSLRTEQISQLINSTILTEEEWKHFRELFDKVHPGFFVLLKEKMPDLTPADTRLLALTKLKLSSREMAGMLGISIESIRKSRYRMRSRLNFPEEDETLRQLIGEAD